MLAGLSLTRSMSAPTYSSALGLGTRDELPLALSAAAPSAAAATCKGPAPPDVGAAGDVSVLATLLASTAFGSVRGVPMPAPAAKLSGSLRFAAVGAGAATEAGAAAEAGGKGAAVAEDGEGYAPAAAGAGAPAPPDVKRRST